jgi:hypothetical protein
MSETDDLALPGADNGQPDAGDTDPVETDPAALSASEELDEDRLQADPLEEAMDPPEHWSAADRWGTTPAEQRVGESLGARLAQEQHEEQPISAIDDDPGAPAADEQFTGGDPARLAVDESIPVKGRGWATEHGRLADEAGGSVAKAIRTSDMPPG